jgi:hypothetical protein
MAWQPISLEVNVRGSMQWMGWTMLSNDSEECGNISSECQEDEGTDCEDRQ